MYLLIFIVVSWTLAHVYLYSKFIRLFPFFRAHPYILALVLLFLYLAIVLGRVLEVFVGYALAFPLTFIGVLWLGIGFYVIFFLLLSDIIGILPWLGKFTIETGYSALIFAVFTSLFAVFQATRTPVIKDYIISIKNLPDEWDGKRIVQLSDLHIGMVMGAGWFKRVLKKVGELNPDIIFITGDVYDGGDNLREKILPLLKEIKAKDGVFVVLGNHEHYNGKKESIALFKRAGWRVLLNACEKVNGVFICGVDDLTIRERKRIKEDYIKETLPESEDAPVILLSHSPLEIERMKEHGIPLVLSGHTHDGQIWPFGYLVRLEYPYMGGLYRIGEMVLVVSSGTGTWGPPMRLFKPGEIVKITLKKSG